MSDEALGSRFLAEDRARFAPSSRGQISSRSFPHYRMDYPRRGVAAIFNHESFEHSGVSERQGSEKDVESLCRTLGRLGFEVETFFDLTFKEILSKLEELGQRDHSQCDCFILVFMSHGLEGKLRSKDEVFDVNYLWDFFTPEQAPTLENKPKIFIIQACQGHGRQGGVRVAEEVEDSTVSEEKVTLVPGYILPSSPDFLIALSTIPGFVSWRNPLKGSWYIQTLCEHLERRGLDEDLITLLTHVGREIAVEHSVIEIRDIDNAHKKQLPSIISYLSKKVQFTKKHLKSGEKGRKRKVKGCEDDGSKSSKGRYTSEDSQKRRKMFDD